MNTITETIPTAFSPETKFAIALHEGAEGHDRVNEIVAHHRFALPPEDEFTHRGIPESVLHD